jgi:hypothetical protein
MSMSGPMSVPPMYMSMFMLLQRELELGVHTHK